MEYSKPIWIGKWEYEIVTVDFLLKENTFGKENYWF